MTVKNKIEGLILIAIILAGGALILAVKNGSTIIATNATANSIIPQGPYTFLINTTTISSVQYFYAYNPNSRLIYGGTGNAGGITGTCADCVIQKTIDDMIGGGNGLGGKDFIQAGSYPLSTGLTVSLLNSYNSGFNIFLEGIGGEDIPPKTGTSITTTSSFPAGKYLLNYSFVDGGGISNMNFINTKDILGGVILQNSENLNIQNINIRMRSENGLTGMKNGLTLAGSSKTAGCCTIINTFVNLRLGGLTTANSIGINISGSNSNHGVTTQNFIGGAINGRSLASGTCVKMNGPSNTINKVSFYGMDMENCGIGMDVEGSSSQNTFYSVAMAGNTIDYKFGASTVNNIVYSGGISAVCCSTIVMAGSLNSIHDVGNFNPVSKIANPWTTTQVGISLAGAGALPGGISGTTYTIIGTSLLFTCSGGGVVTVTIKDSAGNIIVAGLTCATLPDVFYPPGYQLTITNTVPFTTFNAYGN